MRHFAGTPSGGTMHYTLKDHQGSLTATVHGSTVERLCYDPWGRRRNTTDFGYADVRHTSDSDYHDIYSYVERAYEPRDLGLLQLSTDDPTVVWMEENEMHGGGKEGGFYVNLASGLIEHHNGQTNFEYLKQGLLFLAEDNASIDDIEQALNNYGFKYYNTIEFGYLGGFIVDTQEAYQGWQLWKSMPVFASLFSGIAADCLLMNIPMIPIKNTKYTIDSKKYNFFFGKVRSNSHNTARSIQNAKDLEALGIKNRVQLNRVFEKAIEEGNIISTQTKSFGTTVMRRVEIGKIGCIDVGFFILQIIFSPLQK